MGIIQNRGAMDFDIASSRKLFQCFDLWLFAAHGA